VFANTDSNDKIQKRSAHLAENPEFQALGVGPRMRLLLLQRSQKYISGYECGVVPVGSCASRGVCEALSSLYFTVSDPPRQQALDWYITEVVLDCYLFMWLILESCRSSP